MYLDNANSEFIWAVSVPGSVEDFIAVENAYDASVVRKLAGEKRPDCLVSVDTKFVDEN